MRRFYTNVPKSQHKFRVFVLIAILPENPDHDCQLARNDVGWGPSNVQAPSGESHVEAGVQVQRQAESPDERHRPSACAERDRESCFLDVVGGVGAVRHGENLAQVLGPGGE